MARRRAPKPPPFDAQRIAAGVANWKFGARGIEVSDKPLTDLDLLEQWLLKDHPEAAKIAPRHRGRPAGWDEMLQAVRWLRKDGIDIVSDAPGSRCVSSLGKFLDAQAAQRQRPRIHGERDSTAEACAGTLLAILQTTMPR